MTEFQITGSPDASEAGVVTEVINVDKLQAPPAPPTPLFNLKQRRAEILEKLSIDLRVPRFDNPEIWVRFAPVNTTQMNEILEKRRTTKDKDWGLKANAEVLLTSCIGVYAMFPDNPDAKYSVREGDPNGEWTKFDPALAAAFGIIPDDHDTATSVVRKFYLADGDLITTTERLLKFSNISNTEADTVF